MINYEQERLLPRVDNYVKILDEYSVDPQIERLSPDVRRGCKWSNHIYVIVNG